MDQEKNFDKEKEIPVVKSKLWKLKKFEKLYSSIQKILLIKTIYIDYLEASKHIFSEIFFSGYKGGPQGKIPLKTSA